MITYISIIIIHYHSFSFSASIQFAELVFVNWTRDEEVSKCAYLVLTVHREQMSYSMFSS